MDADALTLLYRRYGPLIYSRCRRLLRDDAAAEDATQEVFLRVLRHLDRAPDDREALRWLYRISTNYCLNVLRQRGRQPVVSGEVPLELADDRPELEPGQRELVRTLLSRVDEPLRAPAVLHWLDGLEQGRVAQMLGISRRTVLYRLKRFVEQARLVLGPEGDTP